MIPKLAIDLILESEGIDQPGEWPGEDSGISLGRGYDLGAETHEELVRDWSAWLGVEAVNRLAQSVGKHGEAAAELAHRFRDIHVTGEAADTVFLASTLPKYEEQTRRAFAGFDLLPDLIRGALVSLVFNRGTLMADSPTHKLHDRRRELRAIRDVVFPWSKLDDQGRKLALAPLAHSIAGQFRAMIRLWIGKPIERGMRRRREAEAKLVESALT